MTGYRVYQCFRQKLPMFEAPPCVPYLHLEDATKAMRDLKVQYPASDYIVIEVFA